MRQPVRLLSRALAVTAALALATGCAPAATNAALIAPDAQPTGQPPAAPVKIMPLGDSITDGLTVPGAYRIQLWEKLTADGYAIDFVGSMSNGPAQLGDRDHEGHSGWRIDQIDAQIVGWLQTYQPRTILLHIGTNDMVQNANGAPERLSALIDKTTDTAPDAQVFVATIIPLPFADAAVRAFNAAIPGIVQAKVDAGRHVHLVDLYPKLTSADLADGVHPNATGYDKMGDAWYEALLAVPDSLTEVVPAQG